MTGLCLLLEENEFGEFYLPGQILMFIDVPQPSMKLKPNQPHAVVRLFKAPPKAEFRPPKIDTDTREESDYSLLVEFGNVYDHFHIIPCSYIVEPTIVVPNIPMIPPEALPQTNKGKRIAPLGDGFFVLTPREDWRKCFSNLIRSYNEIH